MKAAALIPSRYASSRFLGKALALINGKTLIERVLERVKQSKNIDLAAVLTDDERIFEKVKSVGGDVFMTPQTCKSGTDRIAYATQNFLKNYDILLNNQGDEPLIDPVLIDNLASTLKNDPKVDFITAACPFKDTESAKNPNNVKVVFDKDFWALFFSRSLIPYNRDQQAPTEYFKHLGIYGYKRGFLEAFEKYEPRALEKAESLEQLRALEYGHKIKVIIADQDSIGVDEPHDILLVEKIINGDIDGK
ncbi:MAG: 3-deoxy-manno-octulosonate cytidylyltransferase [Elusimicrobiota bacterium]|jgi:3-deoxy-manno-octulosonate cytidylyltransferase (CMP-KDO synthetase)|nr:3-deoxy-manno-octulosonate cytidylyltransferase [Elusimicrobiota bacterium]